MESLVIAAVFLVLLASLSAGVFGLLGYKKHHEREVLEFADTAFRRIFSDHDTYFLLDHATEDLLQTGGGRSGLSRFMQDATMRAGDVHKIKFPEGGLRFWYAFPLRIGSEGRMSTEGVGSRGPIRLHLRFGEGGADWKIDGVWWIYSDSVPARDDRR
jgi:hypothetical protein